jgi:hypothetical protein
MPGSSWASDADATHGALALHMQQLHVTCHAVANPPTGCHCLLCCTRFFRGVINEVVDEKGCSSVLFFEARKRQDLYLWMVSVDGCARCVCVVCVF